MQNRLETTAETQEENEENEDYLFEERP